MWATEVEIFATATMLQTEIFVYASAGPHHKLLKFLRKGELSNDDHTSETHVNYDEWRVWLNIIVNDLTWIFKDMHEQLTHI